MSIRWHKWLNIVVSLMVVVGLLAMTGAAVSAAKKKSSSGGKPTGLVKYSDWEFPDTFNPFQAGTVTDTEETQLTMPTGDDLQWEGTSNPHLVAGFWTSVPSVKNGGISKDYKTVKFSLRPGLKWSDGKPITNQDALFAWKVEMDPSTGPLCSGSCDHIKSISLVGKYGVVWHMKDVYSPVIPNADPGLLPSHWSKLAGGPSAAGKTMEDPKFNYEDASYVTAGPYQVTQFINNDRVILKPNKYYNNPALGGKPHIAELEFVFYSDKNTLIDAAARGDTDVTTDYTLADVTSLKSHKNYKTKVVGGFGFEHLEFNTYTKTVDGMANPFTNLKVRQAFALAIDRVGMVVSALHVSKKIAQSVADADVPEQNTTSVSSPYADKAIIGAWDPIAKKYMPYGKTAVADAKKLLAGTPCANGCNAELQTTEGNAVRLAQYGVIAANEHAIGINLTIKTYTVPQLFGDWAHNGVLNHGDFMVGMFGYGGVGPIYDGWYDNFMSQYSPEILNAQGKTPTPVDANTSGIRDKVIDKDFPQAAGTTNPKVRAKDFKAIQDAVVKNAYWSGLFARPTIYTADGHVTGIIDAAVPDAPQWSGFNWHYKK